MKRNHKILLKVSKQEKAKIKLKAEQSGLSVSEFIRFLCLRTNIREVKGLL